MPVAQILLGKALGLRAHYFYQYEVSCVVIDCRHRYNTHRVNPHPLPSAAVRGTAVLPHMQDE